MDAFEKLAKLAGASVESVGDGLPQTRAEALALGVMRYFTGKPCKGGHTAERYAVNGECYECLRQRNATPEYKERKRQHNATPEYKERLRQRNATPEEKERLRQRNATPEEKERQRQRNATPECKERKRMWQLAKTGDAALFAINQVWQAAMRGCAPAGIITQCPEPQRSQLQALVDRIKADPQAGKAVVGLLRTMRELRKAELAELRSEP